MTEEIVLKQGRISGLKTDKAHVYRGVPYAKPPTGGLRFAPPQPPDKWEGVFKANTFAGRCPQGEQKPGSLYHKEFYSNPDFMPPMTEDCLYLNIWTPKEITEPCPVAMWIHGGGFMNGFSSELEFDGDAYAERGIILVSINYRLNIFGFFSYDGLGDEKGGANFGLLDQLAALDWIRENIGAFGGDADNITVFGQSAGGMSVIDLVSSPLCEGKIQKAIIQSAGGYKGPLNSMTGADKIRSAWAAYMKKRRLSLESLREMEAMELYKLSMGFARFAFFKTRQFLSLAPSVDGYVLETDTNTAAEKAKTLSIPYMLGCTKNDIATKKSSARDRNKNPLYKSAADWCALHSARGLDCYLYYFSHDLPGDRSGAFHSAELWYMFGTVDRCWRPMDEADYRISQNMLDGWSAFMKNGSPGWQAYTGDKPYTEEFE